MESVQGGKIYWGFLKTRIKLKLIIKEALMWKMLSMFTSYSLMLFRKKEYT